jgi:FtsZ-interacting cell division protein YlmF
MASMWRRAMHYLGLGPDDEYDDYDEYDVSEPQRPLPPRQPTRYTTPGVPRPVPDPRGTVRTLPPTLGDDAHNGNGNGRHDAHHAYAPRPSARDRVERHDAAERTADRLERDRAAERAERLDRNSDRADRLGRLDLDRGERNGDRGDRGTDRSERDRGAANGDRPADRDRSDRERPAERAVSAVPRPRPAVVRPLVPPTPKPHVVGPTSFNDAQEIADTFKVNVPVILNLQGVDRDLARRIIDFASGLCYGLDGQMERVANQVYLLTPTDVEVSDEERQRLEERGYEA